MTDLYHPDEQAVAWFRARLEADVAMMERIRVEDEGWQRACRWLRWRVLGDETGCVITAFDRRGPAIWEEGNRA